jgi:phospholipid-binding lipoprotein MlaA
MKKNKSQFCQLLIVSFIYVLSSACTTTPKLDDNKVIDNSDPLENTNRSIYDFNEGIDNYLFEPVASAYVTVTPNLFRSGVTNFFENVLYLNVILNSSLQGKLDQSLSDVFRFVFNSTLGVAGLFDVATPMGLERHEEDLGQTLAVWGISQGAYLTLPGLGPSSVRDIPDQAGRYFTNPINYMATSISFPVMSLYFINLRANLLTASELRDEAAIDPYSFTREAYLQSRRNKIYDGSPPAENFDDIFDDEFFD